MAPGINYHVAAKVTTSDSVIEKQLDVAPYIENGRTYVPVRFVSEEFGLDVQWDMETRTVILR